MNWIKIKYFKGGKSICAGDFDNIDYEEFINTCSISSISQIKNFHLPLSGGFVDKYFLISMNNGDQFYIREKYYVSIVSNLNISL